MLACGRVVASGPTTATLLPDLIHEVYGVRAAWTTNPLTRKPLLAIG